MESKRYRGDDKMANKWVGEGSVNNAQGGRLVARYVVSGNTQIQPTSFNSSTGIFTCSGTSLVNTLGYASGNYVSVAFNMHTFNTKILPQEINPVNSYYMYVLSDNTFQLSSGNTSGNIMGSGNYTGTYDSTIDVTQWHLEPNIPSVSINLTGMGLSEIRVAVDGQRDRAGWDYIYLYYTCNENPTGTNVVASGDIDGRSTQSVYRDYWWKYNEESKTLWGSNRHSQSITWGNNSSGTWTQSAALSSAAYSVNKALTNCQFTKINVYFGLCNGSVVEVFDMKGEF